jgi:addiction module RelB/DinJ family antitoxin
MKQFVLMSAQTMLFRTRVPEKRMAEASEILAGLGLNPGDAFNALLAQIVLHRGLPFPLRLNDRADDTRSLLTAQQQGQVWEESLGEY